MSEFIIFILGVLYLIFLWVKPWKKTILDGSRDDLFDLRDSMREYFIQKNLPLNHPVYVNTRDLLNKEIRFIKSITLLKMATRKYYLDKNEKAKEYYMNIISQKYKCDDEKVNNYTDEIRREASEIIFRYIVKTSILLLTAGVVLCSWIILKNIVERIKLSFTNIKDTSCDWLESSIPIDKISIEETAYYYNGNQNNKKSIAASISSLL